jgi:hypothetical protein
MDNRHKEQFAAFHAANLSDPMAEFKQWWASLEESGRDRYESYEAAEAAWTLFPKDQSSTSSSDTRGRVGGDGVNGPNSNSAGDGRGGVGVGGSGGGPRSNSSDYTGGAGFGVGGFGGAASSDRPGYNIHARRPQPNFFYMNANKPPPPRTSAPSSHAAAQRTNAAPKKAKKDDRQQAVVPLPASLIMGGLVLNARVAKNVLDETGQDMLGTDKPKGGFFSSQMSAISIDDINSKPVSWKTLVGGGGDNLRLYSIMEQVARAAGIQITTNYDGLIAVWGFTEDCPLSSSLRAMSSKAIDKRTNPHSMKVAIGLCSCLQVTGDNMDSFALWFDDGRDHVGAVTCRSGYYFFRTAVLVMIMSAWAHGRMGAWVRGRKSTMWAWALDEHEREREGK